MKKIFIPIMAVAALAITSCGGSHEEATEDNTLVPAEEICFYTYAEGSATVNWTAFKTNDKVGVGGKFNVVNVKAGEKSTKITDVLETIVFNIPTSSTNTNDAGRDAKLQEFFFGAMESTDLILGHVKSAEGDNEKGTCTFYLTLNNKEQEVALDYVVTDDKVKLTGEIDVTHWDATAAVESLNKACEALHTGADGISKTWPNVELVIEATLNKDCH